LQWPGFTAYPNEADLGSPGAYIDLTFPSDITAKSIQVIDVESDEAEGGNVILMDAGNTQLATVPIPATGSNGVGTINLGNTQNVRKIRLQIIGSMGFDNLSFCMPLGHCTYTQGYWKNHPDAWPVSSLMLGTVNYTKSQLLAIFSEPVRGNGLISLAHQLIAAKLNAFNGSNTSALGTAIGDADAMIGSKVVPPVGTGSLSAGSTSTLVSKLTSFNEGEIGPGHCQ
ncbi:MAG TPA: hypothetical protein VFL47_06210, partial [Flavisolibacter sp.]|nr:hypothetical protein [Flavisolibacter sp.]